MCLLFHWGENLIGFSTHSPQSSIEQPEKIWIFAPKNIRLFINWFTWSSWLHWAKYSKTTDDQIANKVKTPVNHPKIWILRFESFIDWSVSIFKGSRFSNETIMLGWTKNLNWLLCLETRVHPQTIVQLEKTRSIYQVDDVVFLKKCWQFYKNAVKIKCVRFRRVHF